MDETGETCEQLTSAADSAAASGPAPSSDGNPSMPSTTTDGASTRSAPSRTPDGGHGSATTAPISPTGSRPSWMDRWIASQRASLAAISAQQDEARASEETAQAQRIADASAQSTLFDLPGFCSKTAPASAPEASMLYWQTYATEDIEHATESLPRLMLERPIRGIGGICSDRGPTLTIKGNYNRKGLSETSGDGLATWCKHLLPTLAATDYKSPYSKAGYEKQREKRSKPLRDTAAHTIGIRLTPAFAAWWMGWPIHVVLPGATSQGSGMHGFHCKQQSLGGCSEEPEA